MKLEEQLLQHPKVKTREEGLELLEQIADNFAIGFAKWVDFKYYQHKIENNTYAMAEEDFAIGKTYTIEQLLQIYKQIL